MSVSVAAPNKPPARLASRPTPASSSRAMAPRPAAPRPAAPRPTSTPSISQKTSPTPIAGPSTANSKDTSSSSGKVFAKPSKEWVLPERAKPGRKVSVEEPDSKRQSQNRLSQRAHRARRTDYITTLEERIRQFENDEIHSNVRLQEVARALKADNERLKSEVLSLNAASKAGSPAPKGWEEERGMLLNEIRSLREEISTLRSGGTVNMRSLGGTPMLNDNLSCPICPNPDPDCPCQRAHINHTFTRAPDPSIPLGSVILSPPLNDSCGFCSSSDECLCRAVEEDVKPIILTPPTATMRLEESCGLCADGGFCACAVARNSPNSTTTSSSRAAMQAVSSGVYPAAQSAPVALPLRRINKVGAKKNVWALDSGVTPAGPSTAASKAEAQCTGDPRNCDACRNDTFGQEFCENFYTEDQPEAGPSKPSMPTIGGNKYWKTTADEEDDDVETFSRPELIMACCGDSKLCGHQTGGCTGDVIGIGGLIPGLDQDSEKDTIRVDQAWKTLKAHPNAKFASLAFLADLVAQRAPSRAGTPASPARPMNKRSATLPYVSTGLSELAMKTASPQPGDRKGKRKAALVDSSAVRDALKALDEVDSADEGSYDRTKKARIV